MFIFTIVFIGLIALMIKKVVTGELEEENNSGELSEVKIDEIEDFIIRQQDFIRRFEACLKEYRHSSDSIERKNELIDGANKTDKINDNGLHILLILSYFTSYDETEADVKEICFYAPSDYSFDSVCDTAFRFCYSVLSSSDDFCCHFERIDIYYSSCSLDSIGCPLYNIDDCEQQMEPPRSCPNGGSNCPFWDGEKPCEKCVANPIMRSDNCPIAPDCPFWDKSLNCTMGSCVLGDYIDFPGRLPGYDTLVSLKQRKEEKSDEV